MRFIRGSPLHKFLHLSASERGLVLKAALLLCLVRLALRLFPFKRLGRHLLRNPQRFGARPVPDGLQPEKFGWAAEAVCRRLSRSPSCLPLAITVLILLRRHGYPSDLRIGVAGGGEKRFRAHAWVECQGRVITGGGRLEEFTVLPVPA